MPEPNGVAPQTVSSFDTDFREIRRRAPTDAETALHLTYERLARKSSLDPITIAFIAGGISGDESGKTLALIVERLDRIDEQQKGQTRVLESLARRNGKPATDPIIAESTRYVMAFCLALLIYIATAVIGAGRQPMFPFVGWLGAFAIGILATLAYLRLAPMIKRSR